MKSIITMLCISLATPIFCQDPTPEGSPSDSKPMTSCTDTTLCDEWISVAYNASDFSSLTGGTWTVDASDVLTDRYKLIGKTMYWTFYINSSSSSTTSTLDIEIPDGYTSKSIAKVVGMIQSPGEMEFIVGTVAAGWDKLSFAKINGDNFTATNNTQMVMASVFFEIQ